MFISVLRMGIRKDIEGEVLESFLGGLIGPGLDFLAGNIMIST